MNKSQLKELCNMAFEDFPLDLDDVKEYVKVLETEVDRLEEEISLMEDMLTTAGPKRRRVHWDDES